MNPTLKHFFLLDLLFLCIASSEFIDDGTSWKAWRDVKDKFDQKTYSEKVSNSLGVVLCKDYPGSPLTSNNLIAQLFTGEVHGGWRGNRLLSFSDSKGMRVEKFFNVENDMDGPDMVLNGLDPGTYKLSGWVKLSNTSTGRSPAIAAIRLPGQTIEQSHVVATGTAKSDCWTKIQGGFTLRKASTVTVHIGGFPKSSSVYLGNFAVSILKNGTYRDEQNRRIDRIRKRDVLLKLIDSEGRPIKVKVRLDQVTSEFPFGGSSAGSITVNSTYQNWFKKRFTWTTYENEAKWYYNERWLGDSNYKHPDDMTALFESWNVSIRGHAVFWDVKDWIQDWVKKLDKETLRTAVHNRLNSVVGRYAGRFAHWDVNNEMLHGRYFEERLNNPNFAAEMFRNVKSIDPNVKTFLNDFNVVEYYHDKGSTPEDYVQLANSIQEKGGVVNGLGVQGHFTVVEGPNIKGNLDVLATAGIPIWFTEVSVAEKDPEIQADKFEIILREAFSHPAVEGIVLWGPARPDCRWTNWKYVDASLCKGSWAKSLADGNLIDRPMGKRYVRLRKEWSTHRSRWLRRNGQMFFRGYFGKYRLQFKYKGQFRKLFFYVPGGSDLHSVTLMVT